MNPKPPPGYPVQPDTRGPVHPKAERSGKAIQPQHETEQEVIRDVQKSGIEACELIVGVDFTKSNYWTGEKSFDGKCLHDVTGPTNPYIRALELTSSTLHILDDDHFIPCYGFGDVKTGGNSVFSFFHNNAPAQGLQALVDRYKQIAPKVRMSGPSTFAPLIRQAMKDVYKAGMKLHVLLILADGRISDECLEETRKAIHDATKFPLCIVMIGIGDGPWSEMKDFDNMVGEREWDNFQFFELDKIISRTANLPPERQQQLFNMAMLEELPEQYTHARQLMGEEKKNGVLHIINAIAPSTLIDPPPQVD